MHNSNTKLLLFLHRTNVRWLNQTVIKTIIAHYYMCLEVDTLDAKLK